jgi:hypothetical protein
MKSTICPKCLKSFCSIQSLQRHLQKKFPCKVEKKVEKKVKKNIQNICEKSAISIKNNYSCEYCNKAFNHKNNLYTHKTHLRCKKMPIVEKKKRAIKLLNSNTTKISKSTENEILSLNLIQNNNNNIQINNNNSINDSFNNNTIIQNHITINAFGKEDVSSITPEEQMKILDSAYHSFKNAMKSIHYDIPENRNFYLSNKRDRKFITVYNGKKGIYENNDNFKDIFTNKIMSQLEEWYEIHNDKFLKRRKILLSRMFNDYSDGKLEDKYNDEIEQFLLSYSSDIKELIDKEIRNIRKRKKNKRCKEEIKRIQAIGDDE